MSEVSEVKFRDDMTVKLQDHMGSDMAVIQAMLVSTEGENTLEELYEAEQDSGKSAYGRINFLMKNRHGTPFEHNALKWYVEAPIFVFREWHRHRIGVSYNEMSGRYTQLPPTYYVPNEKRNLVQVGKPGAYEFVPGDVETYEWLADDMREEAISNYGRYEARLNRGVAKEVARMSLGVNIYSAMYFTANARSLMAILSLRTKHPESKFPSFPQREIEMAAEKLEADFAQKFPLTYRSFVENGRVCP